MKLKCYYAHTKISYGSTQELHDIRLLEELGVEVINPNTLVIEENFKVFVTNNPEREPMEFFTDVVHSCDIIAFRAMPDGKIPSGIAFEVKYAQSRYIPIIELPNDLSDRFLTYPQTKKYFTNLGYYRV